MELTIHDTVKIYATTKEQGETKWISIVAIDKNGHRNECTFFFTTNETTQIIFGEEE